MLFNAFFIGMNFIVWILFMCILRRLTHKLNKARKALCNVCEWVARVYILIKSTKIITHSL